MSTEQQPPRRPTPKLGLRLRDVVEATGLSRSTIQRAQAKGLLRFKKWQGSVIFLPRDVERFLENMPDGHAGPSGGGQW